MLSFKNYILEFTTTLEYHDELNPVLWDGDKLNSMVRNYLLAIASEWIENIKLDKSTVTDIIITGGNVNYNYTPQSDIDLHVVADTTPFGATPELQAEYIKTKKNLWADNHNITIKGYPVELYVQSPNDKPHANQGVYSLLTNKWLAKPEHLDPTFYHDPEFISKVIQCKKDIDDVVNGRESIAVAKALKDSITLARGPAISKDGEFAIDNLVFKELRNDGDIDYLEKYITRKTDRQLTLREYFS